MPNDQSRRSAPPLGRWMNSHMDRRSILRAAGVGAGALAAGPLLSSCGGGAASTGPKQVEAGKIEDGAKLKLLRWAQFVDADKELWDKNTKAFTEKTGVPVSIDWETWTDVAPKAATAAHVGSGPDIAIAFYDTPQQFPSKLIDVSDVADDIASKGGEWFDAPTKYGQYNGKWIGIPLGANGAEWNYRVSWAKAAGFSEFPTDTDGLLEFAKAMKTDGHPVGLALGHAVGDANTWCHWLLWAFGGRTLDENGKVAAMEDGTIKALEYAKQLGDQMISGVASWDDSNNNKAYIAGQLGATMNGISIYFSSLTDAPDIAEDTMTAEVPIGPVGKPTQFHQISQAMIFSYTEYPNAAKEYLKFMWAPEQYVPWMQASDGYVSPPVQKYTEDSFWDSKPQYGPYRNAAKNMLWNSYAGPLDVHSAQAMADYVVVDMVARAATGQQTPKESAQEAADRLKSLYGQ
ncbi:MAG TPA: ABC transporter substrate-binding protein [Nocardioidaceae bacterium]